MARDARDGFSCMADRLAAGPSADDGFLVFHPEQRSLDRLGMASSRLRPDRSSNMPVRIELARFQEELQRPVTSDVSKRGGARRSNPADRNTRL